MDSRELRIGNWIIDGFGDRRRVAGFHTGYILLDCPNLPQQSDVNPKEANPIPLTEEILGKCGFVYRNDHRGLGAIMDFVNEEKDNWKYNMSVAFQHETNNKDNIYLHFLQHSTPNNVKYLHQLQNLYFALTNEELTINL